MKKRGLADLHPDDRRTVLDLAECLDENVPCVVVSLGGGRATVMAAGPGMPRELLERMLATLVEALPPPDEADLPQSKPSAAACH